MYTLGDIYFSRLLSEKIIEILSFSYRSDKNLIIDMFCKKYINELHFMAVPRNENIIFEFDTLNEFKFFDDVFDKFYNKYIESEEKK
ncbi:MAG: hypothetical protein HFH68_00990 [Lachnospiraceae bacterium]|nr:hypothetical protein [Lachnospiraceae bacterium]